ncbi:hypothetical protein [Psychroflexus aestuariivivens]|uniref:hypothetical protein n=1 Tax=Psychroflexus aestuariivivens TaxID=1795040 RepID=UPI000FD821E2|nr:hypothetical protein [Psychroflexus aestuariivivens]
MLYLRVCHSVSRRNPVMKSNKETLKKSRVTSWYKIHGATPLKYIVKLSVEVYTVLNRENTP